MRLVYSHASGTAHLPIAGRPVSRRSPAVAHLRAPLPPAPRRLSRSRPAIRDRVRAGAAPPRCRSRSEPGRRGLRRAHPLHPALAGRALQHRDGRRAPLRTARVARHGPSLQTGAGGGVRRRTGRSRRGGDARGRRARGIPPAGARPRRPHRAGGRGDRASRGPAAALVPGRGRPGARAGGEAGAPGAAQHWDAAAPARRLARAAGCRRRAAGRRAPAGAPERARRAAPADRAGHMIDPHLSEALAGVVGPAHVRVAGAERLTYARDGLPTHRRVPGVVVLPGSRDEVVAVVRLLAAHGVPFVPRGAGTGLSGGALADPDAVLVVLTRLSRILKIDPKNRRAVVEPGVVNVRLSAAAAPHGLYYAPDPSSQTACTVGGNVAENAGGPHCLKYGVTATHVLALEVVLADGRVVDFGSSTRITVRLLPLPRAVRTLLADFASLRTAGEAVSAVIASGIVPAALEMMDQSCIRAVEDSVYAAGYPRDAAAVLLAELDGGSEPAVAADAETVEGILRERGARSVRAASDARERERLWQGRKKAFGAMGRLSRDLVVQDAVVPRSALPDVLETIGEIARRYDLTLSNVFHAGDGNLHPNISFDGRVPGLKARVDAASGEIMAACIAAGGTITGEHGVGLDKLRYMPAIFDADSLTAMRAVRLVWDPEERVNPGKVVPIHACREWAGVRNAEFGMRNGRSRVDSAFHIPHSALGS